jgi:CMP-N,N'-diacetyllegionaminic acid synthase
MTTKFPTKKILCTICARGGSKGVPNKNITIVAGLPLIAHSIKQAQESNCFDKIAVSSDDENILHTALSYRVDYIIKRPKKLAGDKSGKIPAIIHCTKKVEKLSTATYDIIVDLDVTAPLRTPEDIINSIKLLLAKKAQNIITGCKARRSPYFNLVETKNNGQIYLSKNNLHPILRRQDSPKCYDMNASIYVWQCQDLFKYQGIFLDKTYLYEMPQEKSVDIDSNLDLKIVRMILEGGN